MSKEIKKQMILDDIVGVYTHVIDVMFTGEQLEKVGNAEKRQEIIGKTVDIAASVGKCLLNIFSCGLVGSIFEGTKDIVSSIKDNKNEIETLSTVYNGLVKKCNDKCEADKNTQKLQTVDEMLEDICKKYKISRIRLNRMSASVSRHLHIILLKKLREKQEKQSIRIDKLEKENIELKKDLKELRKDLENFKKEKEQQNEQMQMLQAMLKELQPISNINQTQPASQRINIEAIRAPQQTVITGPEEGSDIGNDKTNNIKDPKEEQIQTLRTIGTSNEGAQAQQQKDKEVKIKQQFQNLPNRLEKAVKIKLPKKNDIIKGKGIQTPLASQSLDSGIARLQYENKNVSDARKEIEEETCQNNLMSVSMSAN